ncbi:MAG: hypothetical protein AAGD05_18945 [Bacteroidota bacterium]
MGASYYNGQDGVLELKKLLGLTPPTETVSEMPPPPPPLAEPEVQDAPAEATPAKVETTTAVANEELADELKKKEAKIETLTLQNENLRTQLEDKTAELDELKEQLSRIKSAMGQ